MHKTQLSRSNPFAVSSAARSVHLQGCVRGIEFVRHFSEVGAHNEGVLILHFAHDENGRLDVGSTFGTYGAEQQPLEPAESA